MKLMFDLPASDEAVLLQSISPDEKRMYCLPYNFEEDKKVEGFMVFTDKRISINGLFNFTYHFGLSPDLRRECSHRSRQPLRLLWDRVCF